MTLHFSQTFFTDALTFISVSTGPDDFLDALLRLPLRLH